MLVRRSGSSTRLSKTEALSATDLARCVGANPDLTYRLMRALASLGLLTEDDLRGFRLTEAGALLREDHPPLAEGDGIARRRSRALRGMEASPTDFARWRTERI